MVERRLGRGLDFFLSRGSGAKAEPEETSGAGVREIPVSSLRPNPMQPRREFAPEALQELADSIRTNGILQPVVVRAAGAAFELIAGERRWRAAQIAGLTAVPALVREASDQDMGVLALVENVQRADLNPLEKASALAHLQKETKLSQDELARRLGLDRSTVANLVRLLDLSEPVKALVSKGSLSMGHARALLGLADAESQSELAHRIVRDRLSVRDVESLVKAERAPSKASGKTARGKGNKERPAWLVEIEDNLEESLGTQVHVRYGRSRSAIIIDCRGREEFERLYKLLKDM